MYARATKICFKEYIKFKFSEEEGEVKSFLPQLLIFGSGRSDPGWGSNPDLDRPIMVIDFAAFESIMSLVTIGMSVPDLRGADPEKIPELIEKARSFDVNRKGKEESKIELKPVQDTQYAPSSGIIRHPDGRIIGYTNSIQQEIKAPKGKPDTIRTIYYDPPK